MKKLICILFLIPIQLLACDCNNPEYSNKEALKECAVVFIGKFVRWEKSSDSVVREDGSVEHFANAIFEIKKYYKSDRDSTYIVTTEFSNCGMDFIKNKTYIVYGVSERSHKYPYVHQCYKWCPEAKSKYGRASKKELEELTKK